MKIIKHEINIRFETNIVFINKIIKFEDFIFMKTCLKVILDFARYN